MFVWFTCDYAKLFKFRHIVWLQFFQNYVVFHKTLFFLILLQINLRGKHITMHIFQASPSHQKIHFTSNL